MQYLKQCSLGREPLNLLANFLMFSKEMWYVKQGMLPFHYRNDFIQLFRKIVRDSLFSEISVYMHLYYESQLMIKQKYTYQKKPQIFIRQNSPPLSQFNLRVFFCIQWRPLLQGFNEQMLEYSQNQTLYQIFGQVIFNKQYSEQKLRQLIKKHLAELYRLNQKLAFFIENFGVTLMNCGLRKNFSQNREVLKSFWKGFKKEKFYYDFQSSRSRIQQSISRIQPDQQIKIKQQTGRIINPKVVPTILNQHPSILQSSFGSFQEAPQPFSRIQSSFGLFQEAPQPIPRLIQNSMFNSFQNFLNRSAESLRFMKKPSQKPIRQIQWNPIQKAEPIIQRIQPKIYQQGEARPKSQIYKRKDSSLINSDSSSFITDNSILSNLPSMRNSNYFQRNSGKYSHSIQAPHSNSFLSRFSRQSDPQLPRARSLTTRIRPVAPINLQQSQFGSFQEAPPFPVVPANLQQSQFGSFQEAPPLQSLNISQIKPVAPIFLSQSFENPFKQIQRPTWKNPLINSKMKQAPINPLQPPFIIRKQDIEDESFNNLFFKGINSQKPNPIDIKKKKQHLQNFIKKPQNYPTIHGIIETEQQKKELKQKIIEKHQTIQTNQFKNFMKKWVNGQVTLSGFNQQIMKLVVQVITDKNLMKAAEEKLKMLINRRDKLSNFQRIWVPTTPQLLFLPLLPGQQVIDVRYKQRKVPFIERQSLI